MQVNGESIKINNKDFFLSDLPCNMQNEFGNDKGVSYISKNTYALTKNDKNNMYCCGCLDKNNKKHVDLIESIKKAVKEGNKKYKKTTYKQLGDYIKDFISAVTKEKEKTNRCSNVTPLPFDKNGKITYKEYSKYLNSVSDEIDDLVNYINSTKDSKKTKKKKKTKNKDTQADKKEDTKQEDVKKESSSTDKNNYVAKINTENANNNTNSINFE
jgi:hypothetical protein